MLLEQARNQCMPAISFQAESERPNMTLIARLLGLYITSSSLTVVDTLPFIMLLYIFLCAFYPPSLIGSRPATLAIRSLFLVRLYRTSNPLSSHSL